ncbi:MAG: metal ABC transporter substrate-binding protein [Actinomycetota bacterium]
MKLPAVLILVLSMAGCRSSSPGPSSSEANAGISIIAALYPFEFLSRRIAGLDAGVISLARPGVEPHDLELDAGQLRDIARSNLVVYLGGGFQPAVERAMPSRSRESGPAAFDVRSLGIVNRKGDPHVWLDPGRMAKIASGIGERLAQIDPQQSQDYRSRASGVALQLDDLHRQFTEALAECDRRTVVVSHSAFGYMTDLYGLQQIGVEGLAPDSEPTARRLAEIGATVREKGITTIFFERLVSPKLARTLAGSTGTEAKLLDPLESRPAKGDYFDAMRANLSALTQALGCRSETRN